MKRIKFKKLLSELKTLTYKQKQELLDKIKTAEAKNMILAEQEIWVVNVEEITMDATSRIVIQRNVLMVVVVQSGRVRLFNP